MDRAYSAIALKSLDEEQRTFSGIATSPQPDRVLDIVEPMGVKYRNPTVLLRAHDHASPIGEVHFERPTKSGIAFRASIPEITEPGLLRDRVDMAWGEVKHGLVRAVSIGFRPMETEPLPNGGIRFLKSEVYELSTVAIPAQALATIDEVKAIDAAVRRGEVPARSGSALWRRIAAVGRATMDQTYQSETHKSLTGAYGPALAAGNISVAMCKALANHIDDLEQRLSENPLQYRGIWKPDQIYPARSFVTHGGSMFHTDKTTSRKPGEGDWTLAVKRGADAR